MKLLLRLERRELPGQFVVAVPQRKDHGGRQAVGLAQPVDPAVEVHSFGQYLVGREQEVLTLAGRPRTVDVRVINLEDEGVTVRPEVVAPEG